MQVSPRAMPVQPIRVYFGTQQIHARRETRARFDPQFARGKHVNTHVNHVTLAVATQNGLSTCSCGSPTRAWDTV